METLVLVRQAIRWAFWGVLGIQEALCLLTTAGFGRGQVVSPRHLVLLESQPEQVPHYSLRGCKCPAHRRMFKHKRPSIRPSWDRGETESALRVSETQSQWRKYRYHGFLAAYLFLLNLNAPVYEPPPPKPLQTHFKAS